jgi:hypothetical protein
MRRSTRSMEVCRGPVYVSATLRATQERQDAHLLGAGGVDPHCQGIAATRGGLPGRTESERTQRLGAARSAAAAAGAAATFAVRPAALRRSSGRRRTRAGATEGHSPRAAAGLWRRVAGVGAMAVGGSRHRAGVTAATGSRGRVVGHGGGNPDLGTVLRAGQ